MMQPWWRYYEEDGTRDDAKVSDLLSQESTDGSSAALDGELSGTPVTTVSTFKRRPRVNQVARQRLARVSAEMTCSAAVTAGWVIAASSAPVTAWRFAGLRLARMIRRGSRPGCCRAGDRRGACGRLGLDSAA